MGKKEYTTHSTLLNAAKLAIDRFEKHALAEGLFFNVFELLDRHKDEVKCHSALIAYFLDSQSKHGKGDVFYREFLKVLGLEALVEGDKLDYKVFVEKSANYKDPDTGKTSDGRIDLWIESNSYIIIIENKIYAGDQNKQLERYKRYADKKSGGRDIYLFYLNLKGHKPSDDSIGSLEEEDYKIISYKREISSWVQDCIKEVAQNPSIRETMVQYLAVIRKLTDTPIHKELEMELVELLQGRGMVKVALEIQKAVESFCRLQEEEFFKILQTRIVEHFGLTKDEILSDFDGKRTVYYGVKVVLGVFKEALFCFGLEVKKEGMMRGYYLHDGNVKGSKRGMDNELAGDLIAYLDNYEKNPYWLAFKQIEEAPMFIEKDEHYFELLDEERLPSVAEEMAAMCIEEIGSVVTILKGKGVDINWKGTL